VLNAMLEWRGAGWLPPAYDWSHTHARRRGGEPLERLVAGDSPSASAVTVDDPPMGTEGVGAEAGARPEIRASEEDLDQGSR
jgi:hypothetical protein